MKKVELNHLLEAGVHFGHLTSKRHPNMSPYIFMEKNGMHIIDLNKTKFKLDQALLGLKKIAIQEASKLNIKTFAMVDTNSNPDLVDFPIPSNDDASKSIDIILSYVFEAIEEGLNEREKDLKMQKEQAEKNKTIKSDNKDGKKSSSES